MWFYKESYWYKWRFQGLGYSTKNHTGTNRDSSVYVVLQRIILVQIETPGVYGSIKNHTGKNRDYRVYAVLQRILLVQMKAPVSMWFYTESCWYN
jgi:hypothetical protein